MNSLATMRFSNRASRPGKPMAGSGINISRESHLTSATAYIGTMKLVYDNDSGCTHTFNYTSDRMR